MGTYLSLVWNYGVTDERRIAQVTRPVSRPARTDVHQQNRPQVEPAATGVPQATRPVSQPARTDVHQQNRPQVKPAAKGVPQATRPVSQPARTDVHQQNRPQVKPAAKGVPQATRPVSQPARTDVHQQNRPQVKPAATGTESLAVNEILYSLSALNNTIQNVHAQNTGGVPLICIDTQNSNTFENIQIKFYIYAVLIQN